MKKNRFAFLTLFFILFFVFIEIRILFVMMFPDARLKNERISQALRGTITDRNGREIALSSTFYSLYARPAELSTAQKSAVRNHWLAGRTFSDAEMKDLLSSKSFVWIRRKLDSRTYASAREYVEDLKKRGQISRDSIGFLPEQGRLYPHPATANILGVVGIDNNGLAGLEFSLDSHLQQGFDVQTTLDPQLSAIVTEELRRGIIDSRAEFGSVAVIKADTREILSLVNFPTFDPNDLKSVTAYNLRLRATADHFEPGSVMKMFSMAYALEKGVVNASAPVYRCTGFATVGDHEFTCDYPHGWVDPTAIIQKSCNIGMVQVADSFERAGLHRFYRKFGFGSGVDIPVREMAAGIFRPPEKWSFLSRFMVSIGQEIAVTTLQLAVAASVIASDGEYRTPVLVRRITGMGGSEIFSPTLTNYPVLSPANARILLKMMETVVSENGTAIAARVEGVSIAGKTGTGQVARENGKGYYPDVFNSVFVGFIPASRPKYVVTVVINRPRGGQRAGGLVAAPVFSRIVRRMIAATPYFGND